MKNKKNTLACLVMCVSIASALAVDCYKNIQETHCVDGDPPLDCYPTGESWTCDQITGEKFASSFDADAAKLATSKTLEHRKCRKYKVCHKNGASDVITCWGDATGTERYFVNGTCPQGGG